MTYALALALLLVALHLANRLSKAREADRFRQHAEREGIRQEWTMHPWESGAVPTTDRPIGKPLRLVQKREPVAFRRGR